MAPTETCRPCVVTTPKGVVATDLEGWVHSTETFGTADGPGIRYVLFLTGCPLHCIYCHNPDTWHRRDGRSTAASRVLEEIAAYRQFFQKRGGVTVSGGEPLVQASFCAQVLRGCKEMGLHTALDTSGFLGDRASDELLSNVDLVLLDIKAARMSTYRRLTDVDLAPTIAFADRLAAMGKPVWLRYVLVPGFTDRLDDIEAMATFAASLGNVERVDVLPFHNLGEHKWRDRGLDYQLEGVEPPSDEVLEKARAVFHAAGFFVS